jgi:hypothetical protein
MNLKDYLHLYLGCKGIAKTIAPFKTKLVAYNPTMDLREGVDLGNAEQYKFKPLLRPFSDLTDQERNELARIIEPFDDEITGETLQMMAAITHFLISKGFDLFGLIPAGLAIDKTKEAVK